MQSLTTFCSNARVETIQLKMLTISSAVLLALTLFATAGMQAQSFSVIHSFNPNGGGLAPVGGLSIDRSGNLYGTTFSGGTSGCGGIGCGTIFKIKNFNGQFSFEPLYSFQGGSDGAVPVGPLLIMPSGVIYGSAGAGGGGSCTISGVPGCGTIFTVGPPPTVSRNISQWVETTLYAFQGPDGSFPEGVLALDSSGNIYGSTQVGGTVTDCLGSHGCGVVFRLTRSAGGWNESVLHDFVGSPQDGQWPEGGVNLDASGNVYGTTYTGGASQWGTVWQLVATSNWTENLLYGFADESDGSNSGSGLSFDRSGNLYGTSQFGGLHGTGVVFELSSGSLTFSAVYGLGNNTYGEGSTLSPLILDKAGNLYGTTRNGGAYGNGNVFKLTPSNGGWIYTSLNDFCPSLPGCTDGAFPSGSIVMDANGNLYGSTQDGGDTGGSCGSNGRGVVWEVTP